LVGVWPWCGWPLVVEITAKEVLWEQRRQRIHDLIDEAPEVYTGSAVLAMEAIKHLLKPDETSDE